MGKTSKVRAAACIFLWSLTWTEPSLGQDEVSDQEDSTGPEVWGPLWEPAWEDGWFTQATPYTLDVSVGRVTGSATSELRDLLSGRRQTQAEVYAMARLSLPWEAFLPVDQVRLPAKSRPASGGTPSNRAQTSSQRSANDEPGAAQQSITPSADIEKRVIVAEQTNTAERASASPELQARADVARGDAVLGERLERQKSKLDARSALLVLVRALVEEVKNAPGQRNADARLVSLIRRSRTSGLVPELRLRGVYGFDQTTSLEDTVGLYPGDSTTRGGHDSLLEARLTFRLDRLVLGDTEGTLERQRVQLLEEQQKRVGLALSHLLKWKSAAFRAADGSLLPEEQMEAIAEEEEALAHLHLITGGWFRGWPTVKALGLAEHLSPPVDPEPRMNESREVPAQQEQPVEAAEPAVDAPN